MQKINEFAGILREIRARPSRLLGQPVDRDSAGRELLGARRQASARQRAGRPGQFLGSRAMVAGQQRALQRKDSARLGAASRRLGIHYCFHPALQ